MVLLLAAILLLLARTLEHIFPQTPEGKKNVLTNSDKDNIIEMVNDDDKEKVKRVLNKKERNPEEKEIYTDALKRSGYIHHLGNMCLLSNVDNILNGCGFYDEKRTKILKRIKNGGFIPSHTIEVFTKSIFEENPDLSISSRSLAGMPQKSLQSIVHKDLSLKADTVQLS